MMCGGRTHNVIVYNMRTIASKGVDFDFVLNVTVLTTLVVSIFSLRKGIRSAIYKAIVLL